MKEFYFVAQIENFVISKPSKFSIFTFKDFKKDGKVTKIVHNAIAFTLVKFGNLKHFIVLL